MVKLHFLEEEDETEDLVQLKAPKLNRFRPRKPKRLLDDASKIAAKAPGDTRTFLSSSSLFENDDDADTHKDLDIFQRNISGKLKRKTLSTDKPTTRILAGSNTDENENDMSTKRNVKDYLKAYEDPSTPFMIKSEARAEKKESTNVSDGPTALEDTDEIAEGLVITGSDLEDDSASEMVLQKNADIQGQVIKGGTILESQQELESLILPGNKKESIRRRKEILEALAKANLEDLEDSVNNSDDESNVRGGHYKSDGSHTEVIHLNSETPLEPIAFEDVMPSKSFKAQLIFHATAPLEEQLRLTQDKLTSLSDIVSKRELQNSHLKAELNTLTQKTKEYAEQMSQALCHCR